MLRINKKITVILILILAVIFLLPELVSAQDTFGVNRLTNGAAGNALVLKAIPLEVTIARIINIVLGLLGIIATLIILLGGFIWMTSQGNSEKIDQAKKIIINGAIGLLIVMASWGIARWILDSAYDSFFGTGDGYEEGAYEGGVGLGGSVLESHYPARNATDIPRNTNIYVTFKEPMDVRLFLADDSCPADNPCEVDNTYIKLRVAGTQDDLANNELIVIYDTSQKMFEFNPYGDTNTHLGVDNGNVKYQMLLDSLETANGERAFPFTGFYDWEFTVNNEIDLIPPTVVSVLPANGTNDNPRNSAVQINFSEAISPRFVTGVYDGNTNLFTNIVLADTNGAINGEYKISNQYRTVDFLTDTICGQNSCGGEVTCLPGPRTLPPGITGIINGNVADLNSVRDASGNVLDGDYDDIAGGNFIWSFGTSNEIDLIAPVLINQGASTNVSLEDDLELVFSKPLLSRSINSDNIGLYQTNPGDINFWLSLENNNTIHINHDKFQPLSNYNPIMNSGIKDSSQNCWYPCECTDPGGSCNCDYLNCVGNNCIGPIVPNL